MDVTVNFHTTLQQVTPDRRTRHEQIYLDEGATLSTLVTLLKITIPLEDLVLAVNGRMAGPETVLQAGDQVDLIPAIGGGVKLFP